MNVKEKLVELLTDLYGCGPAYYDVDACAIAQHLVDRAVAFQEWISVNDRLPEDGVRVLAAHDDGVVRIGICRGYFPAVMSKKHEKAFEYAEVTHWMPLPDPPKGE